MSTHSVTTKGVKPLRAHCVMKLPEGIQRNVILRNYTTFRIGGRVKYFFATSSLDSLRKVLMWAKNYSVPFFILGGGSNVLVDDEGYKGIVIKIENSRLKKIKKRSVIVGAGMPLVTFLQKCVNYQWSGYEWMSGIPGTIGGAVYGNAGAFGEDTGKRVIRVVALDTNILQRKLYTHDECQFGYRESIFKQKKDIIWEVELKIEKGERKKIKEKIQQYLNYKIKRNVFRFPSAGSIFKNIIIKETPYAKYYNSKNQEVNILGEKVKVKGGKVSAGWFIERCGLKGKKHGGAQIAPFHANIIINTGNAKAKDVLYLMRLMKEKVYQKFKIKLQEEIIVLKND